MALRWELETEFLLGSPKRSDATSPWASQRWEATGASRRTCPEGRVPEDEMSRVSLLATSTAHPAVGMAVMIGMAQPRLSARVSYTLLEGPP